MWERINRQVKFREGFRPFAPAVLEERAREFFDLTVASPYMLMAAPLQPNQRIAVGEEPQGLDRRNAIRSTLPAVTHVDWSSRVQTVGQDVKNTFESFRDAYDSAREAQEFLKGDVVAAKKRVASLRLRRSSTFLANPFFASPLLNFKR